MDLMIFNLIYPTKTKILSIPSINQIFSEKLKYFCKIAVYK